MQIYEFGNSFVNYCFQYIFLSPFKSNNNKATIIATAPDIPKAIIAPKLNHKKPAILLANKVAILWKPDKVPIAVAVSFLGTKEDIQALEIPSLQAA